MSESNPVVDRETDKPNTDGPPLARHMGLVALTIYGVGDMLGAGIYGLVGKAAGVMGNAVWLAFLGSMVAALLTGLSYACIGSRYPRAAGAAYVTHRAYGWPFLSFTIGLMVATSGLTSMATGARVIAGYIRKLGENLGLEWLAHVPTELCAGIFLMLLGGVVFRGIRESAWMNAVCTAVEVAGLAIVISVGVRYWGGVNYFELPPGHADDSLAASTMLVLNGSVLTFFSFIGFEDILNVAEEVKEPRRTIPIALILALVIATIIYMAVSITAVSVVPWQQLAKSNAALVDVVTTAAPSLPAWLFTLIGIFAVANTALLNYVMGSRLLYGMSRQGLLPGILGRVHAKRQTPHVAVVTLLVVVLILALSGDISPLAEATSLLLLSAFVIVNVALIVLKLRPSEPKGGFEVPIFVPALGALVCLILILTRVAKPLLDQSPEASLFVTLKGPLISLGVVSVIVILYLIRRPKNVLMGE